MVAIININYILSILEISNSAKEEDVAKNEQNNPNTAQKCIDLKSHLKKYLIHFGSFKRKDIKLFKNILKRPEINNCFIKISKKSRKPILYLNGEKLGPLTKTLPDVLNKYKTQT